jgi:hypothetical protein
MLTAQESLGYRAGTMRPIEQIEEKRKPGAPAGNENPKKANVTKLKAALKAVPLTAIDRRTTLGAEVFRRREQILSDKGGAENVSELMLDLIDRYLRSTILLESIDSFLFQQTTLVNRKKKSLLPLVQQRTQLVDSSLRLAQAIGLERVKPKRRFSEYVAERGQQPAETRPESPAGNPPAARTAALHASTSPIERHVADSSAPAAVAVIEEAGARSVEIPGSSEPAAPGSWRERLSRRREEEGS